VKREEIAREVEQRGWQGPRVTQADVDGVIQAVTYHQFPGTTVMVCAIILENGAVVTAESYCADPENFDPDLAQRIAFDKAKDKIWALEGYRLRCDLAEARYAAESGYVLVEVDSERLAHGLLDREAVLEAVREILDVEDPDQLREQMQTFRNHIERDGFLPPPLEGVEYQVPEG
jgi:hypothetical protein